MASWNDPSNSNPVHVNLLKDLADKDTYTATMGQTNLGAYTDLPDGTMNWDNGQKLLRRVQSGTPEVVRISLAGGGTGASDAAGARAAFNVLEAGTGAAQARTNTQNDARFVQQTRTVNTTSPLSGGGALSGNLTLSIQDSTTSQKGAVQLNNTLTSTSTSQALTAAQGKVLKDSADSLSSTVSSNYSALYNLFSRLSFSFKADFTGSTYNPVSLTGDQTYWNIQNSTVTRIGTGIIRIYLPAAVSDYSVQATVIDSVGYTATVSGISSSQFDVYIRNSTTGALADQDAFITITEANVLG